MTSIELVILCITALASSTLSAIAGMGGGTTLLGVMTAVLPAPIVVPIHGVVQIASKATFWMRSVVRGTPARRPSEIAHKQFTGACSSVTQASGKCFCISLNLDSATSPRLRVTLRSSRLPPATLRIHVLRTIYALLIAYIIFSLG